MGDFKCEIIEHIATLATNGQYTKELNFVSYNDSKPKLDLRRWQRCGEDAFPLKGMTLETEEARILRDALNALE